MGQAIIFLFCDFYLLFLLFFPRLISPVGDWMSTILPHMLWPLCEFRMQVWNVLHAPGWKYRTQKFAENSLSAHHRTTLSGYNFATNVCVDNRKNLLNSNIAFTCPHNMVKVGPLTAETGSRISTGFVSWLHYCTNIAQRRSTKLCTMAVS